MPTTNKRFLKSWMLVYVSFVVALSAAIFGTDSKPDSSVVSPGTLPTNIAAERNYFLPKLAQSQRNDI